MRVVQKKVCLLGDFAVGKTSLVRRFVEGRFDERYLSTIGVTISRKVLERQDYTLNLLIWDLAGGEDFKEINQRYLLGSAGALIVCDLTRPETLTLLEQYAGRFRDTGGETAMVLIGNKSDLVGQRVVTDDQLTAAALPSNSPWLLTSAKTGQNVEHAFELLAEQIERAE